MTERQKKKLHSVSVCVSGTRADRFLSGTVRSWETILDDLIIYSGHGSDPTWT